MKKIILFLTLAALLASCDFNDNAFSSISGGWGVENAVLSVSSSTLSSDINGFIIRFSDTASNFNVPTTTVIQVESAIELTQGSMTTVPNGFSYEDPDGEYTVTASFTDFQTMTLTVDWDYTTGAGYTFEGSATYQLEHLYQSARYSRDLEALRLLYMAEEN